MEYRVLGQVAAYRDGRQLALGSFRQRSLLAFLLIHANQVVSTDRIIDELWGDDGGPERQNALWVHVSNLRSALEPDAGAAVGGHGPAAPGRPGTSLQVAPGRRRRLAVRAAARRRAGCSRQRSVGGVDGARRGAGAVAGPPLRGLRLRVVRPGRDRPARGAAAGGGRAARRRRPPARAGRRARRRAGGPGPPAPAARAAHRAAHAGAVPVGAAGRRAAAYRRLRARLGDELGVEPSAALPALERAGARRATPRSPAAPPRRRGDARLAVRGYELRERIGEGRFGVGLPRLPADGRPRGGDQGRPRRAGQRPRVHPALRGRGRARGPARAPAHRPALRLLAGTGRRLPRACGCSAPGSLADARAAAERSTVEAAAPRSPATSARRWRSPTAVASSTATSGRRTSCSTATAGLPRPTSRSPTTATVGAVGR